LKSQTGQIFDIRSDGFPTETVCNPQFELKLTEITVLAFNMQTKNVLKYDQKQHLAHTFLECNYTA